MHASRLISWFFVSFSMWKKNALRWLLLPVESEVISISLRGLGSRL